ncbi:amidase domain-containing protein [Mumia zhuanghuii]|uniref:CHAP domain-containing protein n=1 Tax=Mumia zhuanghuii TaxID=2585211 RepID=A0A5C4MCL8_9ACTN|nr:amidase domain-containing protein [Mumia zhuanghuii]TNC36497.1 CHAP domain-containing protein [Mumia zhuanghuii]TNC44979.1 CHAP domain-containing protein [Mumia zhuanghuii]
MSAAYSAATTFTVDTTAPALPTVTCSGGYSNEGTYLELPSATTVCSFSSSADTAAYDWSLDGVTRTTPADSAGKALNATGEIVVPELGSVEIRVTARDRAGNSSNEGAFSFSTGPDVPVTPVLASVAPCAAVCQPYFTVTDSATPVLGVTSPGDDGRVLSYRWELRKAGASDVLATETTSGTKGAVTSWQVPAGLLEEDVNYEFRVDATDDGVSSGPSAWWDLRVDLDAGTVDSDQRAEVVEKVTAILDAQEAVWLHGESAVESPSPTVVEEAGGRTPAFDEALNEALELRRTVTDEGLEVAATDTIIDVAYVQRTADGIRASVDASLQQLYSDPLTGTASETIIGSDLIFTVPDVQISADEEVSLLAPSGASLMSDVFQAAGSPAVGLIRLEEGPLPNDFDGESDLDLPPAASEDRPDAPEPVVEPTSPGSTPNDPDFSPAGAGPFYSYARDQLVAYALKWAKGKMNSDYPVWDSNCANFASQGLHAAGWKLQNGWKKTNPDNWHYNLKGPRGPSLTWSQAKSLYKYAKNKRQLSPLGNKWNAQPGDLYFLDWNNDGDGIDHVAVVTGRTVAGVPRISQRTPPRKNMLLTTYQKKVDKKSKSTKWYPLSARLFS